MSTTEPKITITWAETLEWRHDFTLAEAREFIDDMSGEKLPDDASAQDVADAFKELDLCNDLANIDAADRTTFYGLERSGIDVNVKGTGD